MRGRTLLGTSALLFISAIVLLLWPRSRAPSVPEGRPASAASKGISAANAAGGARATPLRGDLTIRGQVLGPKGPVPGATVVATTSAGDDILSERRCQCGNECGQKLLECGCGEAAGQLMQLVAERRGEVQPAARATTDGDGRFVLTGLSEGTHAIWAEAPRAGAAVVLGIRAGDADVAVNLGTGIEIGGTVRREDGRGVAAAVVTAIYARHSRFFEVAAGSDGAFALGPLPGGDYTVVAVAPGLLPSRERVKDGSSRNVRLELATPRSLTGRVTLETAPVGGAAVSLHGEHKRQELGTEPDGTFAFRALRPGTYELRAAAGERVAQETVTIASGDLGGVTLALRPGVHIQGKVVDDGGAAIPAARITADEIAPSRRPHAAVTRSDAEGRFRLGPLEPGEFELSAQREGYVRRDAAKVIAVETASAELVLVRAQAIRGRVVDPDGKPVREVWVAAVAKRQRGGEDDEAGSARTADDGTFTLHVPGGEYEVTAHPDGFEEVRIPARAPASGVLVRLERGATIEGEVLDEDGAPVADAEVSVVPQADEKAGRSWSARARADRLGSFVLTGLQAGPVVVLARRSGEGGRSWSSAHAQARVEITERGKTTVKLRFEASLAISGSVIGPDGAGVADAMVAAWARRESPRSREAHDAESFGQGTTDRNGAFTIRGLKGGEHHVVVRKEGFDTPGDGVRARAGDSNVRIAVTRSPVVRGRVVGDGGAPLARFRVNGETKEASDGRFAIPVPGSRQSSSGSFAVRLGADGYASAERTLTVERGLDLDLGDVVLSPGRTVSGVVVDAGTGGPIAAARVRPILAEEAKRTGPDRWSDPRSEGLVVTAADGTFAIPHVGEGTLLRVARDGYAPATVTVGPDPGPLRVALGHGGAIAIRILAASGDPMSGMQLTLMGQAEGSDLSSTEGMLGPYLGKTDASGRYEASGLLPGTYFVRLSSADRNPGLTAQPVLLREGQRVEVELRARKTGTTLQLSISGSSTKGSGELHVRLVPGVVPPITAVQDLMNIVTAIEPRDDDAPDAPVFEPLEPGTYTVVVVTVEGDGFRAFAQQVDVGPGPRQRVDVVVPEDLPLITP